MALYNLPIKYVPAIYHVVLLRNPQHTPGVRNHALSLVASLHWTEQECLAGGVHLVAGQHVALTVKQVPSPCLSFHLLKPVPAVSRIAAVCKLTPPPLPICGRLETPGCMSPGPACSRYRRASMPSARAWQTHGF